MDQHLTLFLLSSSEFILLMSGVQFVGAFAKLRKVTISFLMSVCPSVRMEQLGSQWTDFNET
jgi:hypothetical protein